MSINNINVHNSSYKPAFGAVKASDLKGLHKQAFKEVKPNLEKMSEGVVLKIRKTKNGQDSTFLASVVKQYSFIQKLFGAHNSIIGLAASAPLEKTDSIEALSKKMLDVSKLAMERFSERKARIGQSY